MKELIMRILSLLKSNKKKAFSGLILAVLFILWKKKEKIINYDKILGRFQEKIMHQLEKNIQEQQAVARRLNDLETIKNNFFLNIKQLKIKFSKQINQLFMISELKEDLKKKDLKPQDKQQLWDRFKDENLLFDIMIISVFPLLSLTSIIKELVLGKFINQEHSPVLSKLWIEIIEKILGNFIEHLNNTGINESFFYLGKLLQPEFSKMRVSNDMNAQSIFEIFQKIENEVLTFGEKKNNHIQKDSKIANNEKGLYWKNGITERLSGVDYNEIGNYLIGKAKNNENKTKNNISNSQKLKSILTLNPKQKLSIPLVILEILKEFLSKIKSHSILTDKQYLISEISNLKKNMGQNNILDSFDKSSEIIDEIPIIKKSIAKKQNIEETEETALANIIITLCYEIIEWIESTNFQVLFYHYIRFNFFKLRTRLILHEVKIKNDKMKLANYLTVIYRIMNEEYLAENSEEINDMFYKAKIKNNLANSHSNGNELKEIMLNLRVLQEYELNLRLQESMNEVLKRVYLDEFFEEEELQGPVNSKNEEGKEFNEIMTILKQLG